MDHPPFCSIRYRVQRQVQSLQDMLTLLIGSRYIYDTFGPRDICMDGSLVHDDLSVVQVDVT